MGKDHTLFSVVTGKVLFAFDPVRKRSSVSVVDVAQLVDDTKRATRVFDLVDTAAPTHA